MASILLLSNCTPNYHHFFNCLVNNLSRDGNRITIATDSKFSKEVTEIESLGYPIYEFSQYFSSHIINEKILIKYKDENLNHALYSDFERAQIYKIWEKKDITYFDRLKSALLTFYETIFTENNIDNIIYENVSNTFAYYAYIAAKKNGINYIGIGGSRLPGRFYISNDPLRDDEPEKIFQKIKKNEIQLTKELKNWCKDYIENLENKTPDYMINNGLSKLNILTRYFQIRRIKTIITLLKHRNDDANHSFQIGNPITHYRNLFIRNLLRKFKAKKLLKLYEEPNETEAFFLYPLHFHPESSTSILASTYTNEYEVIRNIAFNLPEGTRLYVKDHLSAYGYPSINFYNMIKNLPNVRLISPFKNIKQLIKKSTAVITLTSTAGFEALLLNKKVFLFGNVFYEHHKNITKILDPSKIFIMLSAVEKNEPAEDLDYNIDFLAAYQLSTKPGKLNLMLSGDEAKKIVEEIYPVIKQTIRKIKISTH